MAPSAKRSRTRFGIRQATLYASMALPAPNSAARTCSRTTPRIRLAIVATPADAAERASVPDEEGDELGAKLSADRLVDRAAVRVLAGKLRHDRLHDLPDILWRRRACFRNRGNDGSVNV